MLTAVLVKGNPKFIKGDEAQAYYNEIVEYMESLGVSVIVDPGADYTCPPKADFYVAHSRGCGRYRCFDGGPQADDFLMFGDPDGIMHPKDRKWHEAGRRGIPPNEHFLFIDEQKQAIEAKVIQLKSGQAVNPQLPRQSAARRPGVR